MPFAIVHHFPGGTKEQYEASIAVVHPSGRGLPKGQLYHAAGPYAGGWSIVAVHDSKESWEQFRDGVLVPQMRQGITPGMSPLFPASLRREEYSATRCSAPAHRAAQGGWRAEAPPCFFAAMFPG